MNDITFYIYSTKKDYPPAQELIEEVIENLSLAENLDYTGYHKEIHYDGSPFPDDVDMEFEISKEELKKKIEKNKHHNITLIGWQEDSPLKELIEPIEDIVKEEDKESEFLIDDISMLLGKHIISGESKEITTSFSLALYSEFSPADSKKSEKEILADKQFKEQLDTLSEIFQTKMSAGFGKA